MVPQPDTFKPVPTREQWAEHCERYWDAELMPPHLKDPEAKFSISPEAYLYARAVYKRSACNCEYRQHQDKGIFTQKDFVGTRKSCIAELLQIAPKGMIDKYLSDYPVDSSMKRDFQ